MLGKFLMVILMILILLFSYILYQNMPGEPNFLKRDISDEDRQASYVNYGDTPVFRPNLRFASTDIPYYIEQSCTQNRRNTMIAAFNIFEQKMEVLNLYESNYQDAQIYVGCSNDYIELGERLFAAGEGGPSKILNTSGFKVVQEGKISLYRSSNCEYPVVEIHELSHVFGFDHSNNPLSIMYNTSDCDQRITPDMIRIIKELYAYESLADLSIESLTAIKRGRYFDFNITVVNIGLAAARNVKLSLTVEGKVVEEFDMENVGIGYGKTLQVTNTALPSRDVTKIDVWIDIDNHIKELNELNNHEVLTTEAK